MINIFRYETTKTRQAEFGPKNPKLSMGNEQKMGTKRAKYANKSYNFGFEKTKYKIEIKKQQQKTLCTNRPAINRLNKSDNLGYEKAR